MTFRFVGEQTKVRLSASEFQAIIKIVELQSEKGYFSKDPSLSVCYLHCSPQGP